MNFDPSLPLPFFIPDLPGLGGRIKQELEDFEVEEVPAYTPSGAGDFLYLWIEKRDLGAEYFTRMVARRLGVRPEDIGTAGLKDRRAVTRQWVSVPAQVEAQLNELDGEGIRLLQISRHGNKLKPGHLRGNRFRIRIREVDATAATRLPDYLERIKQQGMPNFYGPQRFGREGETLALGLGQLQQGPTARDPPRGGKFLRKLALSAAQSALFNQYLACRLRDGLLYTVLPGDVMAKWPFGGLFVAGDVPLEQVRFQARETVSAGPMFGRKMFCAAATAAEREAVVLADAGLTAASFEGFGKLLQGTRRHNLIYIDDLTGTVEGPDALLAFTLSAGSYATVLLREIMKQETPEGA